MNASYKGLALGWPVFAGKLWVVFTHNSLVDSGRSATTVHLYLGSFHTSLWEHWWAVCDWITAPQFAHWTLEAVGWFRELPQAAVIQFGIMWPYFGQSFRLFIAPHLSTRCFVHFWSASCLRSTVWSDLPSHLERTPSVLTRKQTESPVVRWTRVRLLGLRQSSNKLSAHHEELVETKTELRGRENIWT